jgi:hypothetical protein
MAEGEVGAPSSSRWLPSGVPAIPSVSKAAMPRVCEPVSENEKTPLATENWIRA